MGAGSKTGLRKSPGGGRSEVKTEIEIKLRVRDRRELLRQLARLGAEVIVPRVHEMNTLYDTAGGDLMRHGCLLRVRVERRAARGDGAGKARRGKNARGGSGVSALLTYKGPGPSGRGLKGASAGQEEASPYKIREEHEVRLSDHAEAERIIEALGFRPSFRYEKFRTSYRLPRMKNLKVEVDETPIGLFLELEGPRGQIDRAARLLGFGRADYINKSYGELFMEERGAGRRSQSRKRVGAALEAGKSHHEPSDEPTDGPTGAQPGVAVPRDKLARFSGIGDMLFRTSR